MKFDVSLIVRMTDDELKALIVAVVNNRKTAKKKVQKLIQGDPGLMDAWLQSLSMDPPKALPEEIEAVRKGRKDKLEQAMIRNPDAFVHYQVSMFLFLLLEEIRKERLRRVPPPRKR